MSPFSSSTSEFGSRSFLRLTRGADFCGEHSALGVAVFGLLSQGSVLVILNHMTQFARNSGISIQMNNARGIQESYVKEYATSLSGPLVEVTVARQGLSNSQRMSSTVKYCLTNSEQESTPLAKVIKVGRWMMEDGSYIEKTKVSVPAY